MYRIRIRTGDVEVDAPHHMRLIAPADGHFGYSAGGFPLPDPTAGVMDVILVPDLQWQTLTPDQTPPCGYTLIFENVPIPTDGDAPAGPYKPRVVWPKEAARTK